MLLSLRYVYLVLALALGGGVVSASCGTDTEPVAALEQEDDDLFNAGSTGGSAARGPGSDGQPLDPTVGLGVGGGCEDDLDCRYGLVCAEEVCRAIANTAATGFCFLTDECAEGLYCSYTGICRSAGFGLVGASCATSADCARGLHCRSTGLLGSCAETGQADIGEPCTLSGDCFAGLFCDPNQTCAPWSTGAESSLWQGLDCADAEGDSPRPYFELDGASGEFYRLPYPNDLYLAEGVVDLASFPRPGSGVIGFDPIEALGKAASRSQQGFSLTPTVTFRFSAVMDFQSLSGSGNSTLEGPTIHFVNVDPESPGYGGGPSYNWHVTDGSGSAYICPRWLALRVGFDKPLAPGTTYAAYLSEGARDQAGTPMVADSDFAAMLEPAPPSDPARAAAWDVYAPLRAYLADKEIPAESIIGGTVFTTQRPMERMLALRAALSAPPAPAPKAPVLCGTDADSPCTQAPCAAPEGDYDLIHMQLDLPRVQQGVRPFWADGDGGGLSPAGEDIQLHGSDQVCASLSLPRGEAPPEGWPLLLFAHDGDGDHQSAEAHLAELMAEIGVAVLSWNGPMVGERGEPGGYSEALIYNLANPSALLGSLYQGAADVFSLVRMIGVWSMTAESSPSGEAVQLDSSKVAFMGHGLGASIGAISVPHEPGIGLSVWSSASAVLSEVMAGRLVPHDVPASLATTLHEESGEGLDARHPVLTLYQGLFEPVDPRAHLAKQGEVDGDLARQHSLQIQGVGDWYAPSRVSDVVARLIEAQLASPILREIEGVESVAPPVVNNVGSEAAPRTSVVIQSSPPDGPDGEPAWAAGDAWREDFGVRQQVQAFIQTWIEQGVPTLEPRTGL